MPLQHSVKSCSCTETCVFVWSAGVQDRRSHLYVCILVSRSLHDAHRSPRYSADHYGRQVPLFVVFLVLLWCDSTCMNYIGHCHAKALIDAKASIHWVFAVVPGVGLGRVNFLIAALIALHGLAAYLLNGLQQCSSLQSRRKQRWRQLILILRKITIYIWDLLSAPTAIL